MSKTQADSGHQTASKAVPARIIFCQPTLRESGSEHSLLELLAGLQALYPSLALSVLAGQDGPMAQQYAPYAAVDVVPAPKLRRDWLSILPHVRSYLRVYGHLRSVGGKETGVVLYVNTLMFPQAILAGWLCRLPVVVHIREVATTYPAVVYFVYYALASLLSDRLVAVCHAIFRQRASRMLRLFGPRRREVIYNSSDMPHSVGGRTLNAEGKLLAVIPFTPRKGALDLMQLVLELRSNYPSIKFSIDIAGAIADADCHRRAIQLLDREGCLELVRFHGAIGKDGLAKLYDNAAVFVHPSRTEAFPRVLVEAMNFGLPCVTTDAGGSAEAVQDGKTGFVVPVGDFRSMAAKVAELLTNKPVYTTMADAARIRHSRCFTRALMASKVLRAVSETSADRGRG